MYLSCNTNNKAATVLEEFLGAVKKYGLPSRVRGGMDIENADLTWYIFTQPKEGCELRLVETFWLVETFL